MVSSQRASEPVYIAATAALNITEILEVILGFSLEVYANAASLRLVNTSWSNIVDPVIVRRETSKKLFTLRSGFQTVGSPGRCIASILRRKPELGRHVQALIITRYSGHLIGRHLDEIAGFACLRQLYNQSDWATFERILAYHSVHGFRLQHLVHLQTHLEVTTDSKGATMPSYGHFISFVNSLPSFTSIDLTLAEPLDIGGAFSLSCFNLDTLFVGMAGQLRKLRIKFGYIMYDAPGSLFAFLDSLAELRDLTLVFSIYSCLFDLPYDCLFDLPDHLPETLEGFVIYTDNALLVKIMEKLVSPDYLPKLRSFPTLVHRDDMGEEMCRASPELVGRVKSGWQKRLAVTDRNGDMIRIDICADIGDEEEEEVNG